MSSKYISTLRMFEIMGIAGNQASVDSMVALIAETAEAPDHVQTVDGIDYVEHFVADKIAYEAEGDLPTKLHSVFAQVEAEFGPLPAPKPQTTGRRRAAAGTPPAEEAAAPTRTRRRRGGDSAADTASENIAKALQGVPNDNPEQEPSKVIESPSTVRTRELTEQSKGYSGDAALHEAATIAEIAFLEARLAYLKSAIAA